MQSEQTEVPSTPETLAEGQQPEDKAREMWRLENLRHSSIFKMLARSSALTARHVQTVISETTCETDFQLFLFLPGALQGTTAEFVHIEII